MPIPTINMVEFPQLVFVVGAGASCPYGLPSGEQLRNILVNQSTDLIQDMDPQLFVGSKYRESLVVSAKNFSSELLSSGCASVDTFLAHRPDYLEIGKLLTCSALIRPQFDALNKPPIGWDWLGHIFHSSIGNIRHRTSDSIGVYYAFITFNYDRLIRFSLQSMATTCFNIDHAAAAQEIRKIPICHMYGSIDYNPYKTNALTNNAIDFLTIRDAAKGIRIIGEERVSDEMSHVDLASNLLFNADKIVFLGFGFDSANLSLLGLHQEHPSSLPPCERIVATTRGIEGKRYSDLSDYLSAVDYDSYEDCLNLVQEELSPSELII